MNTAIMLQELETEIREGICEFRPDHTGTVWVPPDLQQAASQWFDDAPAPVFTLAKGEFLNIITVVGIPMRMIWGLHPINFEWR